VVLLILKSIRNAYSYIHITELEIKGDTMNAKFDDKTNYFGGGEGR
jgi:hypothetical protein